MCGRRCRRAMDGSQLIDFFGNFPWPRRGHIKSHENKAVTPAKAGVQWLSGAEEPALDPVSSTGQALIRGCWIPACAGMTLWGTKPVFTGPYFHRNRRGPPGRIERFSHDDTANPAVTRQPRRLSGVAQAFSLRRGRDRPPWADRNVRPTFPYSESLSGHAGTSKTRMATVTSRFTSSRWPKT